MPKSHRYFPWANGTNRASLSAVPPSRTGSIACDGGWWWGPRADYPVWPRFDRAWDGGKSRSRRQRSKAPCSFDLGSGGVFFQATPKAGHSLVAGLKITVDWTFQNKAQPLQPVACLARFEFDIAFLAQKLHHHHPVPACSLQSECFWRLRQGFLQFPLRDAVQSRGPARTGHIVYAVESKMVGFANPIHYGLTTQAKQSADGRRFPPRQKQKESGNADSHPSSWDRVGHAEQRFACNSSVRNLERFHA